jgi:hypothetical protein
LLHVTRFDDGRRPAEVSFRTISDGPIESFYWVEGSLGYVSSAPPPGADVMALAQSVCGQLAREQTGRLLQNQALQRGLFRGGDVHHGGAQRQPGPAGATGRWHA